MKIANDTAETKRAPRARACRKATARLSLERLKSLAIKTGIQAGHAGYCCGCRING